MSKQEVASVEALKQIPWGICRELAFALTSIFVLVVATVHVGQQVAHAQGWFAIAHLSSGLLAAILGTCTMRAVFIPWHPMTVRKFFKIVWANNWNENYEIWQSQGERAPEVVYRGPAVWVSGKGPAHVPFPNYPQLLRARAWAIALPIGNQMAPGIVTDENGYLWKYWNVSRVKAGSTALRITDDSGATQVRTLAWFLGFLSIKYPHSLDWQIHDSWRDAIDGFQEMVAEQKVRIENLLKERDELGGNLNTASVNLTTLGAGIEVAILDLLSTKRFGKHGGQVSRDAMRIRKSLFAVFSDVFGDHHPWVIQLALHQRLRPPVEPATKDEAVQKVIS